MCFVRFSQSTQIISLYSFNWLVFVMEICVSSEVGTEFLILLNKLSGFKCLNVLPCVVGLVSVKCFVYTAHAAGKIFSSCIKLKSLTLITTVAIYVHVITHIERI
jgi:hypothetical protein